MGLMHSLEKNSSRRHYSSRIIIMISISGSQRRKKKQGIPRQPCSVRRKRGRPTAGPPLLSFSCVPHIASFIIMRKSNNRLPLFFLMDVLSGHFYNVYIFYIYIIDFFILDNSEPVQLLMGQVVFCGKLCLGGSRRFLPGGGRL